MKNEKLQKMSDSLDFTIREMSEAEFAANLVKGEIRSAEKRLANLNSVKQGLAEVVEKKTKEIQELRAQKTPEDVELDVIQKKIDAGVNDRKVEALREELGKKYFGELWNITRNKNMNIVSLLSDLQEFMAMSFGDDKHAEHYRVILNEIKQILIAEGK